MNRPRPLLLAILDGLALNPNPKGNAVFHAVTSTLDTLFETCPHTTLITHGERVGLPEGQMGNSEVGHLNIGGGRIVKQELTRINEAISNRSLSRIEHFSALARVAAAPSAALHLIGLVSLGGVHSQRAHLEALVVEALQQGVRTIFIHAITDGRDRPPTASLEEVVALQSFIDNEVRAGFADATVEIVSVVGRYYAMDRDKRWERTLLGYNLFVLGEGEQFEDVQTALSARIAEGQTDEFMRPCTIRSSGRRGRTPEILPQDAVIFFNFRADRMRQIVTSFFAKDGDFTAFERRRLVNMIPIATLTDYDPDYPVRVLFPATVVPNHLGQVLAAAGLRQLRIAETEKYAHVTYFFNGGAEDPSPGEERLLVPSPRDVPTYDLKPEMSAPEVTDRLIEQIEQDTFDVIILNFANCDMVGHTGSFEAAVRAVETVDSCLGRVLEAVAAKGGAAIVTADHGNADQMLDYVTGEPHTFHTTHPVPLILVGTALKDARPRSGGSLCDIAPTICAILGIPVPPEMTGRSLI